MDFLIALAKYEKDAWIYYPYKAAELAELSFSPKPAESLLEITQPEKPSNMLQTDFEDALANLHVTAIDIFNRYLTVDAKNEVNLPDSVRKPLTDHINEQKYNPAIFFAAKKHISELLQTNNLGKFLKIKYEEKINAGLSLKISTGLVSKLDQLFLDQLSFPYTYQGRILLIYLDFYEFSKMNSSIEEVEFCRSVMQYQKLGMPVYVYAEDKAKKRMSGFFGNRFGNQDSANSYSKSGNEGDTPQFSKAKKPKDMSTKDYESLLKQLEAMHLEIFELHLKPNAPKMVSLPPSVIQPLLKYFEQGIIHPDILTRAYLFFSSNLDNNTWEPYCKTFETTSGKGSVNYPKNIIRQIINQETPSPYSYEGVVSLTRLYGILEKRDVRRVLRVSVSRSQISGNRFPAISKTNYMENRFFKTRNTFTGKTNFHGSTGIPNNN